MNKINVGVSYPITGNENGVEERDFKFRANIYFIFGKNLLNKNNYYHVVCQTEQVFSGVGRIFFVPLSQFEIRLNVRELS